MPNDVDVSRLDDKLRSANVISIADYRDKGGERKNTSQRYETPTTMNLMRWLVFGLIVFGLLAAFRSVAR